ncbi:MAG: DUF294 nucleotidyltransferase-like domain-containing protein [Armatimonadetes bacterium]|nr:DUF294 nucleotidyltransferase-like domain-containing protein [Armatimonadota bacterium]
MTSEPPDTASRPAFADPARAERLMVGLAGGGVTDDDVETFRPALLAALAAAPDPDRALTNICRLLESVTGRITQFRYLGQHPTALPMLTQVLGTSQFLADILVRNPEYLEILTNPNLIAQGRSAADMHAALGQFTGALSRPQLRLEAMRRFRQREVLRIGARDILGSATMPETAREFSHLADACVQQCLEIAEQELAETFAAEDRVPLCVIGMGKLGGEELNYSSDIDLMFVYADLDAEATPRAARYATRLAELIVSGLSKRMENSHLFRVDMRLRPEGRFGSLARSISSYALYYESWAEPWERQALLKARTIAGDAELGRAFMRMAKAFVYRRNVTEGFIDAIRGNKRRIEQQAAAQGRSASDVKVGVGGIRDVEFSVQLCQLVAGCHNPWLRTPNTLEALARLRHTGILRLAEADDMAEDYIFLRNVEHRLQLLYERQTQALPAEPAEVELLAHRLGFPDGPAFQREYARRTQRNHAHYTAIFLENRTPNRHEPEIARRLVQGMEAGADSGELEALLAETGVVNPASALRHLRDATIGGNYGMASPATRQAMGDLMPSLLACCGATPDPDAALAATLELAEASPNPAEIYRSLAQAPELLERVCRLGAGSPGMARILARRPEWLDMLVDESMLDAEPKAPELYTSELTTRLRPDRPGADLGESFWQSLALYIQRERLRTAARDLWGDITAAKVRRELTALADAVLGILLERARKLAMAERLSEAGAPVEIDARLRPEGRFGALVRPLSDYAAYYRDVSQTWERQALVKARVCAGNAGCGREFMRLVWEQLYSAPLPDAQADEVRQMKRRMEAERLKPEMRDRDLKLGHGGMSDIEFATQLLQLRHGSAYPPARAPGTVGALLALARHGGLRAPDASRLADNYRSLMTLRNRLALLGGGATDLLPDGADALRKVAIGMGCPDLPATPAGERLLGRVHDEMLETRAIIERVFYQETRQEPHAI